MKKLNKYLSLFFLFTSFCVAPLFAQEKNPAKENLLSEFEKIKTEIFADSLKRCDFYNQENNNELPVNLEFFETDLKQVLNHFTERFGCKFAIDNSVEKTQISVFAKEISLKTAIEEIFESANLSFQFRDSTFYLTKNAEKNFTKSIPSEIIQSPLHTEFIKLENFQINSIGNEIRGNVEISILDQTGEKFYTFTKKLLSQRGLIEIDKTGKFLIITDVEKRTKLISGFVKLMDKSGFTLEEIFNEPILN